MSALSSAGLPAPVRGRRFNQYVLVLVVVFVAAAAWIMLALLHGEGHSLAPTPSTSPSDHGAHTAGTHAHHHHHSSAPAQNTDNGAPVLDQAVHAVAGWGVMIVAMMLPPALPLLQTVHKLVSSRRFAPLLTLLSAGAFIAAWTAVGLILVAGYFLVRAMVGDLPAGWDLAWVPGLVIILAGVYQFTPLKDLCLRGCRSPRSFVLAHWQGRRTASTELLKLTGAYSASCIGCCWALMVICFVVGVAALPVMVALTVVMAAERLVSWGRRLVRPVGAVLVALGLAMLAGPALSVLPMR